MAGKGNANNLTNAGKGRIKGAKNKFTTLKDHFLYAFDKIGGEKELAKWAVQSKNRVAFYQMIAKMLPNKVEGEFDHTGTIKIVKLPMKGAGWEQK